MKFFKIVPLAVLSSNSFAACPDVDLHSLWLPSEKAEAKKALIQKAKKLNSQGQCVVEGSFGRETGKFYITVSPTGGVVGAKILRFTRAQLDQ